MFIDPVATGFSRPVKDEKADQFFGDSADLDSIGEFIRLWTTRHERWLSPKYLCGESYGVFRAAGLADHLRARYGMYLNGLILVSGVLDFATIWEQTRATTCRSAFPAGLHGGGAVPQKTAAGPAIRPAQGAGRGARLCPGRIRRRAAAGRALSAEEREKVVAELARLTGLKPQVIEDNNLRVDPGVFRKQLLHDEVFRAPLASACSATT